MSLLRSWLACISVTAFVAQTNAGILANHAFITLESLGGTAWADSVALQGSGTLNATLFNEIPPELLRPGDIVEARNAAFTSLFGLDFMGVAAAGRTTFGVAGATSAAEWRDIAFTPFGETGSVLRLHFDVSGILQVFGPSRASISVFPDTRVEGGGTSDGRVVQLTGDAEGGSEFEYAGIWDSLVVNGFGNGVEFRGSFHLDTPYDANYGGYPWRLFFFASAHASTFGAATPGEFTADASSLRSIGLRAVTDLHGNPVAVTFDSGLTMSAEAAVPEPASLAIWGLGALGMAIAARWRRKQPVAECLGSAHNGELRNPV